MKDSIFGSSVVIGGLLGLIIGSLIDEIYGGIGFLIGFCVMFLLLVGRNTMARINKMEKFIKNIGEDYDCDMDGHRYNTGCRKCEARDLLNK